MVEESQNQLATEEARITSDEYSSLQKRSTNDDLKEKLEKAVQNFQAVLDSVMHSPGNRFTDMQKMMKAETELDAAVHKVRK